MRGLAFFFAAPGEAAELMLPAGVEGGRERPGLLVRHGASLRLISDCSRVLNSCRGFKNTNPEKDFHKYKVKPGGTHARTHAQPHGRT